MDAQFFFHSFVIYVRFVLGLSCFLKKGIDEQHFLLGENVGFLMDKVEPAHNIDSLQRHGADSPILFLV